VGRTMCVSSMISSEPRTYRVSSLEIYRKEDVSRNDVVGGRMRGIAEMNLNLETVQHSVNLPPSCHWSILGSRRSCSGWFALHLRIEGYRGKVKWGCHPFRCRHGAPKYWVDQPF